MHSLRLVCQGRAPLRCMISRAPSPVACSYSPCSSPWWRVPVSCLSHTPAAVPSLPCSAFFFPPVESMGQVAVRIENLTHGYNGRTLFKDADLVIEKGERVAIIGPNGARLCGGGVGWGVGRVLNVGWGCRVGCGGGSLCFLRLLLA